MSNTNRLWSDLGWQGLLIDGESTGYDKLTKLVADKPNVKAVQALIAPRGWQTPAGSSEPNGSRYVTNY